MFFAPDRGSQAFHGGRALAAERALSTASAGLGQAELAADSEPVRYLAAIMGPIKKEITT
jgi:hypothetical protein